MKSTWRAATSLQVQSSSCYSLAHCPALGEVYWNETGFSFVSVLLYVHRNHQVCTGRPTRLSHSSCSSELCETTSFRWCLMTKDVGWHIRDQCVSMFQYCFTSTETMRLVRTENPGRPSRLSHSSCSSELCETSTAKPWYIMSGSLVCPLIG